MRVPAPAAPTLPLLAPREQHNGAELEGWRSRLALRQHPRCERKLDGDCDADYEAAN
jgi:hypothetical protein